MRLFTSGELRACIDYFRHNPGARCRGQFQSGDKHCFMGWMLRQLAHEPWDTTAADIECIEVITIGKNTDEMDLPSALAYLTRLANERERSERLAEELLQIVKEEAEKKASRERAAEYLAPVLV